MKKIFLILFSVALLCGCSIKEQDNLKKFKDVNAKNDTYKINGTMKIVSNEDEFIYDLTVSSKDSKYYKVELVNTVNDHEQIILKNDSGVYVLTPELNKSFKFQSEWPNNSSQAYIIECLLKDINSDAKATIKESKDGYILTAKVNYPNNQKLETETITVDKEFNIKKVEVKNKDDLTLLTVEVNDIDYRPKFASDYFELDNYIVETDNKKDDSKNKETTKKEETTTQVKTDENCMKECTDTEENCKNTCKIESTKTEETKTEETEETSKVLNDIIYPLYVPSDTYLQSKDTVSTEESNRHILTFAGVDPFILVEEAASVSDEFNIIPVSGEPLLLGGTIAALGENSITWTNNGIDYYLTSNTLDNNEMITIAESITNGTSLVAGMK